jgi:hypothetical protein
LDERTMPPDFSLKSGFGSLREWQYNLRTEDCRKVPVEGHSAYPDPVMVPTFPKTKLTGEGLVVEGIDSPVPLTPHELKLLTGLARGGGFLSDDQVPDLAVNLRSLLDRLRTKFDQVSGSMPLFSVHSARNHCIGYAWCSDPKLQTTGMTLPVPDAVAQCIEVRPDLGSVLLDGGIAFSALRTDSSPSTMAYRLLAFLALHPNRLLPVSAIADAVGSQEAAALPKESKFAVAVQSIRAVFGELAVLTWQSRQQGETFYSFHPGKTRISVSGPMDPTWPLLTGVQVHPFTGQVRTLGDAKSPRSLSGISLCLYARLAGVASGDLNDFVPAALLSSGLGLSKVQDLLTYAKRINEVLPNGRGVETVKKGRFTEGYRLVVPQEQRRHLPELLARKENLRGAPLSQEDVHRFAAELLELLGWGAPDTFSLELWSGWVDHWLNVDQPCEASEDPIAGMKPIEPRRPPPVWSVETRPGIGRRVACDPSDANALASAGLTSRRKNHLLWNPHGNELASGNTWKAITSDRPSRATQPLEPAAAWLLGQCLATPGQMLSIDELERKYAFDLPLGEAIHMLQRSSVMAEGQVQVWSRGLERGVLLSLAQGVRAWVALDAERERSFDLISGQFFGRGGRQVGALSEEEGKSARQTVLLYFSLEPSVVARQSEFRSLKRLMDREFPASAATTESRKRLTDGELPASGVKGGHATPNNVSGKSRKRKLVFPDADIAAVAAKFDVRILRSACTIRRDSASVILTPQQFLYFMVVAQYASDRSLRGPWLSIQTFQRVLKDEYQTREYRPEVLHALKGALESKLPDIHTFFSAVTRTWPTTRDGSLRSERAVSS